MQLISTNTPRKFHNRALKHNVVGSLSKTTEFTPFATLPTFLKQLICRRNYIFIKRLKKNFNLQRKIAIPNIHQTSIFNTRKSYMPIERRSAILSSLFKSPYNWIRDLTQTNQIRYFNQGFPLIHLLGTKRYSKEKIKKTLSKHLVHCCILLKAYFVQLLKFDL